MQIALRMERVLSLPRYVSLIIVLVIVLLGIGGVFSLLRANASSQSPSSSLPSGVQCVLAPVIEAPPSPSGASQSSHTSLKAICPSGYVPQPTGHAAPKGMPRP
jgi:predicted PurR-regulated permease PerM